MQHVMHDLPNSAFSTPNGPKENGPRLRRLSHHLERSKRNNQWLQRLRPPDGAPSPIRLMTRQATTHGRRQGGVPSGVP